jgi:hypothetical protein
MRLLVIGFMGCMLGVLARPAALRAESGKPLTELTVMGDAGAMLSIDGQPMGLLPLPRPLSLPAGLHRFLLTKKGRRYESDVLTLPEGRVVEISLTPGAKGTAIAMLSLTPMILLALRNPVTDEGVLNSLRRAAQEGTRAEHTVLVPAERVALLKSSQAPNCSADLDCQLTVALEVEARTVLVLELPVGSTLNKGSALCGIHGQLIDVSTGQSAAQAAAEADCPVEVEQQEESIAKLVRQLVREAASVGKGTLVVTTSPSGARIALDGRPRGVTPWQGPSVSGQREVLIEKDGYLPLRKSVTVSAGQSVTLPIELSPVATPLQSASAPKSVAAAQQQQPPPPSTNPLLAKNHAAPPRWRFALGGSMIGLGLVTAGFGISGLSVAGQLDSTQNGIFETTAVGASLLGVGILVAAGGTLLLVLPSRIHRPPRRSALIQGARSENIQRLSLEVSPDDSRSHKRDP